MARERGVMVVDDPRDFRVRQRAIREEAILTATAELVAQAGYDAMSTDDVAARVGISKRTLYDHFPSKELLVVRVVTSGMEKVLRAFDAVDPSLSAIDRLAEALRIAVRRRLSLWAWGQPLPRAILERHQDYVLIRRQAGARLGVWLEEGKRQGSVVAGLPTPLLARLLLQWFSADLSGIAKTAGLPEAEVVEAIVRIMLGGVRA
jgi:TetR/AcrR family transcriptional regulator, regulator of autoinduction and epiphytic fitness